ncbi:MAG: ABC transporter permease [Elusimicrobia bacterium]|nr:ABC transporter permease [Elusimicrobiota bacterium]
MQMNPEVSPQTIESLRQSFGLDRPVFIQYFYWLKNILRFNLGESFSYHIPVSLLIKQKLKNTLAISAFSIFFTWLIAIPLGIFAAVKQGRWQEKSLSFLAYIGISLPSFLIAMLLVFFAAKTSVLPVGGTTSAFYIGVTGWGRFVDYFKHLLLPGTALTLAGIGGLYRLMKNNFLEVLGAPYVVTANAKGLSSLRVYSKHVFRNAINPMITIFGYTLSSVLSGAALVEIITNWPGMGRLMLEAVLSQDLYLVMASLLIGGILLIAGNLVADILIAVADPRVRLR